MPKERPASAARLNRRIRKLAGADANKSESISLVMSYVVAAQMMPRAVIKGGAGLELRYGDTEARFSTDLDGARVGELDTFVEEYRNRLFEGWQGFSGVITALPPATPKDVPDEYVMRPFEVALSYEGDDWRSIRLELGHNEIGDANESDNCLAPAVLAYFTQLGFEDVAPVPLMRLEYQVAQKLHAVSSESSQRAHDLVDLQIILNHESLDFAALKSLCVRLFSYRRRQAWPPVIVRGDKWSDLYTEAAKGLNVLADVQDAIDWANGLIARIEES